MSFQAWAVLSALFAGITAVLGKKGVEEVPSNLAVAIRVAVVLVFAFLIAGITHQTKLSAVTKSGWLFLAASGVATGASWLCYYRALQLGPVSTVAPIDKLSFVIAVVLGFVLLKEKVSVNTVIGCIVIGAGVLMTLKK